MSLPFAPSPFSLSPSEQCSSFVCASWPISRQQASKCTNKIQAMASSPQARCATTDDLRAYDKKTKKTTLPASTCFSPAADRHPPRRAPDPDRRLSAQIPEPSKYPPLFTSLDCSRPPSPPPPPPNPHAERDEQHVSELLLYTAVPSLPAAAATASADAPFLRRIRDLPRVFTNDLNYSSTSSSSSRPPPPPPSPLRHVTAPRAWPPRKDSLSAPTTSGVR